jgi:hypothetical protein
MPSIFLSPGGTGKRAVYWSLFFFACAQVALGVYLNGQQPDVRDPAFGLRLRALRQRLAENPGSPLVLVMGSSRALNGLAPAHMPVSIGTDRRKPLVFNFAFVGSGSIRELMYLRRLRAEGIRPDYLLLETWPVLWPEDGTFAERKIIGQDELRWIDVPVCLRYLPGQLDLLGRVVRGNLMPLVCYRSRLIHSTMESLLPRHQARQFTGEAQDWTSSDGLGWLPRRENPDSPEALRREVERGRHCTEPLLNPLRIAPGSDRALRALLDECRTSGIEAALFLMPEHGECRRWYSPQARTLTRRYLTELRGEYHVPAIDMRDWLRDEDFSDFCHMLPRAAAPLSERFGREAVQPWLRGEPLDRTVLVQDAENDPGSMSRR